VAHVLTAKYLQSLVNEAVAKQTTVQSQQLSDVRQDVRRQADQIEEVRAAIDKANRLHGVVVDRFDRTDRAMDLLRQEAAEAQAQRVREIKQARTQGNTELREVARQVKQLRGTVERLLLASADRGNRGE
jgi:23S rRNA G2069 N7-methylase RlmK/C1962 C5-methylase RlmI